MNIDSSNINQTTQVKQKTSNSTQKNSSVKFADELKELENTKNEESEAPKEFDQIEENPAFELKLPPKPADNTEKGEALINNDFNIQDKKDILPQMNPNMNFSGDGQPFSSFMGNEDSTQDKAKVLASTAAELAEEAAILSTMAENIALANKNNIVQETEQPVAEKVVNREEGIKKVDIKSGITVETVVKYDNVIMNEADVEVFAALADKGEIKLDNLAPEAAQKSVHVSKTLADMLAKAKETQQPLRIDFDNGISVIIKISRDGKVSADFLPSTQIAEAYLKENLPLLKQRFDEKNLEYEELNRRERREQKEDNQKKGRRDE